MELIQEKLIEGYSLFYIILDDADFLRAKAFPKGKNRGQGLCIYLEFLRVKLFIVLSSH